MLKLRDLATRSDFEIGPLYVSPSTRRVRGPAGQTQLEPLIMQVFLLLLDADGRVVTRDELFDQCWGGVIVGDDSLNRAIAKVRRISDVAPGLFEIETIPRTGYRLTGPLIAEANENSVNESKGGRLLLSRRAIIGTGAAAAAAAGAAGFWWLSRAPDDRFNALMARGDEAFRNGGAFENSVIQSNNSPTMIDLYERAVRLEPDNAKAWGLLAYFRSAAAGDLGRNDSGKIVAQAQAAADRALQLDPKEPNARVGMFLLNGAMFDLQSRDRLLREILGTDPANLPAMMELMILLQTAGLTRESWTWNERILRASPFARPCLTVRALKLWILGHVRESDNVIDRVRALWPDYAFATYARLVLFALTGRPGAARALLDSGDPPDNPSTSAWRSALSALESPTPSTVNAARAACVTAAETSPAAANDMVMLLCAMGFKDAAFDVTDGFLLWRGKIISKNQVNGREVDDYVRHLTQWLFTPPLAIMRADPRFPKLCEDFGLTAYWRARNVKPDYQVYG